jgi:hypothetical protein
VHDADAAGAAVRRGRRRTEGGRYLWIDVGLELFAGAIRFVAAHTLALLRPDVGVLGLRQQSGPHLKRLIGLEIVNEKRTGFANPCGGWLGRRRRGHVEAAIAAGEIVEVGARQFGRLRTGPGRWL